MNTLCLHRADPYVKLYSVIEKSDENGTHDRVDE